MDELGADILAYLLEQLSEQVGQQSTRRHHPLVRVSVTVILGNLAARSIQQLLHHTRNDLDLTCDQDLGL